MTIYDLLRRCDKCGNIFSELEVGWQTYTATTVIEDEKTGEQRELKQASDCQARASSRRSPGDSEGMTFVAKLAGAVVAAIGLPRRRRPSKVAQRVLAYLEARK